MFKYFFYLAVESYLAVSREGQLGVTGEGTLLDHAQGKQINLLQYKMHKSVKKEHNRHEHPLDSSF